MHQLNISAKINLRPDLKVVHRTLLQFQHEFLKVMVVVIKMKMALKMSRLVGINIYIIPQIN